MQVVDLVRTVSILVVLAIHLAGPQIITKASQSYWENFIWYKVWVAGAFGVSMFFVISGFLITRLIASNPRGLFNPDFRDFYSRRFGRIIPLLALICLIGIILIGFVKTQSRAFEVCFHNPQNGSFSPWTWGSIATFSFNWYKIITESAGNASGLHWDVLWSLSIEEQFYFLYPFVLKTLGNRRNLSLFLAALVIAGPISILLLRNLLPHSQLLGQNSFAGFNLIALGCLLYLVSNRFEKTLLRRKKTSFFLCLFGFFLFLDAYIHQDYRADVEGHFLEPTLIGLGVFFFLLGGLHLDFFESRILAPLAWPGKLSYGGYLLHVTVLFFLWPFLSGLNEFLAFFLFAAGTFTAASISYRFYELPANYFFRRVLGRPHKKGA